MTVSTKFLIRTARLDLIAMTPAFLRASISGDLAEAERQIQLSLPTGWPDIRGVMELRLESPGGVEYGFTIFPPHRRRGYAREASLALMQWAHELHGVTGFVVSVSPNNVASQALAADLGFARAGSHVDDLDGIEDVLVLNVAAERGR